MKVSRTRLSIGGVKSATGVSPNRSSSLAVARETFKTCGVRFPFFW